MKSITREVPIAILDGIVSRVHLAPTVVPLERPHEIGNLVVILREESGGTA